MDHRGLRARLAGAGCTSCGAAVPGDRIEVLADRGDVAFVELDCGACGSRTMSLVLAPQGSAAPVLDTDPPAIDEEDVRAVAAFLSAWGGDLRSLVGRAGGTGDAA